MIQLILHLIGDYLTQSHWMAENKTKSIEAAFWHSLVYSLPFLLIGSIWAFFIILWTHVLIDRFRLARFVVYAKNRLLMPAIPKALDGEIWLEKQFPGADPSLKKFIRKCEEEAFRWSWENCSTTGYPSDVPPWLSVWLLIAADNTLHLAINYAALRWL